MNRFSLTVGLAAMAASSALFADGDAYSFGMISDSHFGGAQFYAPDNAGAKNADRYPRWMSREVPNLERAGRELAAAPAAEFVLHTGDLVDGRCGSLERQATQLEEGWRRTRGAFDANVPFIPVNGNHETYDFEAPGTYAYPSYERTVQRRSAEEIAKSSALRLVAGDRGDGSLERHFAFRRGPDLFVAYNSNVDEYEFVRRTFEENPDARHVFLFGHIPAINPVVDGIEIDSPERGNTMETHNRFLRLLQGRDAILLCGDTHRLGFVDYVTGEGRLTELMGVSVCDNPNYAEMTSSPNDFPFSGARATHLPGQETTPRQEFLRGGIVRFWGAHGAGFWKIRVDGERVTADFTAWDRPGTVKSVVLRGHEVDCKPLALEIPQPIRPGANRLPIRLDPKAVGRLSRARWVTAVPEGWTATGPHVGPDGCWLDVTVPNRRATVRETKSIRLTALDRQGRIVANEDRHFTHQDEFALETDGVGVYLDGSRYAGGVELPLSRLRRVPADFADMGGLWSEGRVLELFFDVRNTKAIARGADHVQIALAATDGGRYRAVVIGDGGSRIEWVTIEPVEGRLRIPWKLVAPSSDPGFVPPVQARIGIDAAYDGDPIMGGTLPMHKVFADPSVWGVARLVPKGALAE